MNKVKVWRNVGSTSLFDGYVSDEPFNLNPGDCPVEIGTFASDPEFIGDVTWETVIYPPAA